MTYRPKCAPAPGDRPTHPWRFCLGDELYLYSHLVEGATFKVVDGELNRDFPHYHLLAPDGSTWRVPQLHLLTKCRLPK